MAEPSFHLDKVREKLVETLFEKHAPPAVFLGRNAMLSSFAVGRQTSLVVDAGHEATVGEVLLVPVIMTFATCCACTRLHVHVDVLEHTHAHSDAHTFAHPHTLAGMHAKAHAHAHAYAHAHALAHVSSHASRRCTACVPHVRSCGSARRVCAAEVPDAVACGRAAADAMHAAGSGKEGCAAAAAVLRASY